MAARLLVIEDDPGLLTILEAALSFGGFESRACSSGAEAIEAMRDEQFDAILMDLGLPDISGDDLLRCVRGEWDTPIIVVSGRNSEQDRIAALDLGADDFISKPFLPGELLARVRATLRRYVPIRRNAAGRKAREEEFLTIGAMTLHFVDRTVRLGDKATTLTEGELTIIEALARNQGEVVSRDALMKALYGQDHGDETKIVDVYLSRIRGRLRELTAEDLIETIRGRGWRLSVPS